MITSGGGLLVTLFSVQYSQDQLPRLACSVRVTPLRLASVRACTAQGNKWWFFVAHELFPGSLAIGVTLAGQPVSGGLSRPADSFWADLSGKLSLAQRASPLGLLILAGRLTRGSVWMHGRAQHRRVAFGLGRSRAVGPAGRREDSRLLLAGWPVVTGLLMEELCEGGGSCSLGRRRRSAAADAAATAAAGGGQEEEELGPVGARATIRGIRWPVLPLRPAGGGASTSAGTRGLYIYTQRADPVFLGER